MEDRIAEMIDREENTRRENVMLKEKLADWSDKYDDEKRQGPGH